MIKNVSRFASLVSRSQSNIRRLQRSQIANEKLTSDEKRQPYTCCGFACLALE